MRQDRATLGTDREYHSEEERHYRVVERYCLENCVWYTGEAEFARLVADWCLQEYCDLVNKYYFSIREVGDKL